MPSDNQLCTVLLLVALGFLINYLCKSKKDVSENFADELVQESKDKPVVTPPTGPAPVPVASAPPVAEPVKVAVQAPTVVQTTSQVTTSAQALPKTIDNVFKFGGNDVYLSGADLDLAFTGALTEKETTDMVNLNKNNVQKYDAKDFLPKEINDKWFDTDFSQAKFNLNDDKLINTDRYVIGVNTVGQSLKNASYDIRGTVANPKFTVSPWNNSTYEADTNIKSLC